MLRRLVVLVSVMCLWSVARAQPLAQRMRSDTLVYVGWHGTEGMPPAYAQSHLKAFLESSDIPSLFSQFYPRLVQRVGLEDKEAAGFLARISAIAGPLSRHPTALSVGPVDLSGAVPQPRLALACQAGAEADALLQQLADLAAMAPPNSPPMRASKVTDLVVFSIGYAEASAALAGDASTSLTQTPAFKKAMAEGGNDPILIVYANVEAGLAQVVDALKKSKDGDAADALKFIDSSGIEGIKSLICTGGFDGPNWTTHAFVAAPAPRQGILKLVGSQPLSETLLKAVPRSATWMTASHADLAALMGALREWAGKLDPNGAKELEQGLGLMQATLGLNLQTDLFEALGSEWALYSDPSVAGHGWSGFVLVNHLRKPELAEKSLNKLWLSLDNLINGQLPPAEHMRIAFTQTKVNDLQIHYLGVPLVAPAWAIRGERLYIALYPQFVASADVAAKGPSILENPDFQALRQHLGGQQATAISFGDLPRSVGDGYQTMLMLLQMGTGMADLMGAEAPAMLLPPLHVLQNQVTPAGDFAWVDDAGYHYRGQTPFPGAQMIASQSTLWMAYGAALLGTVMPDVHLSRERANRIKCASNLRQIGQGCLLYANDHKGNCPPNLGALLEEDLPLESLVCPSGQTQIPPEVRNDPKKAAQWANEHSDYVYLAANKRDRDLTPDTIVCYEKEPAHDQEGMNMLFGDGHVEWMNMAVAQDKIKKQKEGQGVEGGKL